MLAAEQVQSAGERLGVLVLIMGLLHAATIIVLPVVALVSNSTRAGRALPRWLVIVLAFVGIGLGLQVLMSLLGLLAGLS